ncbi:MAG: 2,4-dihydroxyhept-2-ene-1,7-dioic acid aldolase [Desulfobacteraceae bacterium]|nr:MAG: 2,4-dihydroxyhept-2-ene-1,7-dioic acid aldolase [Desulfobacteraceae bacterium]
MLASRIKTQLKQDRVSIGTWLTMGHLSVAEILADAGYDWVMIETEHTAIDVSEVLGLIMAVEGRGAIPLVRLAGIDPIQAKAVLDAGAAGVMVPMVNSKEDAEAAVDAVKYPPLGQRGACGAQRGQGYGFGYENYIDYVRSADENTLLMVQIEHIDAVNAIEDILSVQGIDGTFIGPYDLSMSMGLPGQLDHAEVQSAKSRVLEATRAKGLAAGIHIVHPGSAVDELNSHLSLGYRFIALGTDILFMANAARNLASRARQVCGRQNA